MQGGRRYFYKQTMHILECNKKGFIPRFACLVFIVFNTSHNPLVLEESTWLCCGRGRVTSPSSSLGAG